jgi:SAM-dependent methyltransferase
VDIVLHEADFIGRDNRLEERHMAPGRLRTEWVQWACYNLRRGIDHDSLVGVLVTRGVPDEVAREELGWLTARGPDSTEPTHGRMNGAELEHPVAVGARASIPWDSLDPAHARDLLAGGLPVPWNQVRSVLCLAAGGGRQGPAFASLGIRTTVVDASPEQLARDRQAAAERNLNLECLEAEISDLRLLDGREYDLVYQPVSTCCLGDLRRLYQSIARLLRPAGTYWVEHWNPLRMQLDGLGRWCGEGYRVIRPITGAEPLMLNEDAPEDPSSPGTSRHYVHSLQSLLGDMCAAGLELVDMRHRTVGNPSAPPGSAEHLAAFVPPFIAVLACKCGGEG